MKIFVCFIALFLSSISFANQLHNFDQIKSAVSQGKLIRLYVDYTKCNMLSGSKMIGNHYAVYTPNAMAINDEGNIGTYILYFTMKDPQYPSKAVYQYVRYLISKTNEVGLTFTVLNAADYTPLGDSSSLNCKINVGVKVFTNQREIQTDLIQNGESLINNSTY